MEHDQTPKAVEHYQSPYGTEATNALHLNHCGIWHCEPSRACGPAVRDHYLIHCILQGRGYFEAGGMRHSLGEGDAFLIRPGESTFYIADETDPWYYCWVGFSGNEAAKALQLLGNGPILHFRDTAAMETCVRQLITCLRMQSNPFARQSELYRFFSLFELSAQAQPLLPPATVAQMFFRQNLTYAITVEQAADYAGVSRSHLFRLFRKAYGMSPQTYLCKLRLEHAAEMLLKGSSVTEAAYSSGFSDLPHFSRQFRQTYGVAPSQYRAPSDR